MTPALKRSASGRARSAVRLATVMLARMLRSKVRHAQLDHLARADEQTGLIADAGKDAFGKAYRGGGH
jgi:hypothetical protein